jgi:hypothetical protein
MIIINLGSTDMSISICSSRMAFCFEETDWIRTAVRNLLERHQEAAREKGGAQDSSSLGDPFNLLVLGSATIAAEVSPNSPSGDRILGVARC